MAADRLLPACLLVVVGMSGVDPATAGTDAPRKSVLAIRIDRAPVLDGNLGDAAWQQAAVVEDLHVIVPDEYAEPPDRSRIYIAYDDDALYLAARFWDREPDDVTAMVLRRGDFSWGEDGFTVTLDPYDNGRSGYLFDINPNGMRSEGLYLDVARQNWDWDGIWDGAAHRDGEGWTAEVAIPFKSLSFDPAVDDWGINFTRWLGRRNEQYGWVSRNHQQTLAQTGKLSGINGIHQGRGIDLVPGLRVGSTHDYVTDEKDSVLEPSLDAFLKITPSMTAALTLNPDFAGTTADARQINLTRFDLFFLEQRAFFLQDSDIFEFGRIHEENGRPFFSRRIGLDDQGNVLRLDGGLKTTGRIGDWNLGVLGVRQDSATGPGTVNLFAGRVATNVLAESSVGAIFTSGNPDGVRSNSLVGLDFRYVNTRLGEDRSLEATAWVQQTRTQGLHGDDAAYGAEVQMQNSTGWRGGAGLKTFQENYFPALGFANRTDIADYDASIGYTWRPAGSRIRSIYSGVSASFIDSINGADRTREIKLNALEIENQTADVLKLFQYFIEERLAEPFEISDGVVIPAGDYSYSHFCLTASTGEYRAIATITSVCNGHFYDGDLFNAETTTTWRPNKHLKFVVGMEYNDIHLPQGDFTTRLLRLNADVAFNVRWSWENFVQYDNVSDTIGINSILRWIPRAGRETVLAVNSQYEDFDESGNFHSLSSDLTLKLSHTFRF